MQKCYAQNAETLCSTCRDVMLKMQKCHAQHAEMSCSKCRNIMLSMQRCYAQNGEMSRSKCRTYLCITSNPFLLQKCGPLIVHTLQHSSTKNISLLQNYCNTACACQQEDGDNTTQINSNEKTATNKQTETIQHKSTVMKRLLHVMLKC